jgi:AmiR/NasT family two-component response regulator
MREHELAEQLRRGLDTRTIIGQAQGILMERAGLNEREAFETLRRASQHRNVKLRDVAARVVETGEFPVVD